MFETKAPLYGTSGAETGSELSASDLELERKGNGQFPYWECTSGRDNRRVNEQFICIFVLSFQTNIKPMIADDRKI